jgi:hypothetical protein
MLWIVNAIEMKDHSTVKALLQKSVSISPSPTLVTWLNKSSKSNPLLFQDPIAAETYSVNGVAYTTYTTFRSPLTPDDNPEFARYAPSQFLVLTISKVLVLFTVCLTKPSVKTVKSKVSFFVHIILTILNQVAEAFM